MADMDEPADSIRRVLQITDCHLYQDGDGELLGANTLACLREVLEAACCQPHPLDALVVTGDLAHDCVAPTYHILGRELADRAPLTAALPGNHDDPEVMRAVLPQYGVGVCERLRLDPWQLILLDSHIPDEEGGHLAAEELERLETLLADGPEFSLIFVHHHPVPVGSEWIDAIGLANGDQLLALAERHPGVRGIVWGHVHQAWEGEHAGTRLLATPSTCIQFLPEQPDFALDMKPPGWREFELHPDGRFTTRVRHLDDLPPGVVPNTTGY